MGFGQEMDGCGKCMKYSLFAANFLILIGGIIVLSVGIYTVVDTAFLEQLLSTNLYKSSAYILIITGAVVIMLAFLGCMGAVKEVKCMLLTYFVFLLLIFVVMLVGAVLGYVYQSQVEELMEKEMQLSMPKYLTDNAVKVAWDNIQTVFKCCGIKSYVEWAKPLASSTGVVPASCCKPNSKSPEKKAYDCTINPSTETTFEIGCLVQTVNYLKSNAAIIGGVGIAVACLMILGMIFSCALFKLIE